jgi:hypothetical protein
MLVFITSMRHPHNAYNYRKLELLLDMSLRSVCSQTDPDFRVVVVCNARPNVEFTDPRITYHVVDFPAPCAAGVPVSEIHAGMRDKGTRFLSGVLLARKLGARHVAFFDADDLVSRRVARFVNARPDAAGWYTDSGYVLDYPTWRVQRKHGLVRYCGTVLITKAVELLRVSEIDQGLGENSSQQEILAKVPLNIIKYILGDHRCMAGLFARHGLRMRPLPFRGAVWVLRTGENFGGSQGVFRGVPLTARFREEFGLSVGPPAPDAPSLGDRVSEELDMLRSRLGALRFRLQGFPSLPSS